MPAIRSRNYLALPPFLGALLLAAGCHGHASIHRIPMRLKKISTTKPLIQRITPDECYYWVNDEGNLCVAMREAKRSIFGVRFRREFILSLVLEGLPADAGRNYRVDLRTLRARRRAGYTHTRAASLAGIATVWDYGKRRLRGRFRLYAKEQSYSVLTGWAADQRVVIIGEFTAVQNRQAGEAILARTEQGGMDRPPPRPKPKRVTGPPRSGQTKDE